MLGRIQVRAQQRHLIGFVTTAGDHDIVAIDFDHGTERRVVGSHGFGADRQCCIALGGGFGELRVDQLSRQIADEGVKRIALVSDEPATRVTETSSMSLPTTSAAMPPMKSWGLTTSTTTDGSETHLIRPVLKRLRLLVLGSLAASSLMTFSMVTSLLKPSIRWITAYPRCCLKPQDALSSER